MDFLVALRDLAGCGDPDEGVADFVLARVGRLVQTDADGEGVGSC